MNNTLVESLVESTECGHSYHHAHAFWAVLCVQLGVTKSWKGSMSLRPLWLTFDLCTHSSYLMFSVHSKVYQAICRVHMIEDRQFTDRCRNLKGCLTPSLVGLCKDYNCPYTKTLSHLNKMELCHSPLERLYCLQDAMVRNAFSVSISPPPPPPPPLPSQHTHTHIYTHNHGHAHTLYTHTHAHVHKQV